MTANGSFKKHELLSEEQKTILKQKGTQIEQLQTDIATLSKPLVSKGSPSWSENITPGTLSVFKEDSSWDTLSEKNFSSRPSQELSKANGSNWNTLRDVLTSDPMDEDGDYEETGSEGGSPTSSKLDASDMKTFGTMPMDEQMPVVKCKSCQRPFTASGFKEHAGKCKKEKGNGSATKLSKSASSSNRPFFSDDDDDEDDDMGTGANKDTNKKKKKSGAASSLGEERASSPAKRPSSSEDKKKLKKEKKAKVPKAKAPLDLDKQCGVIQGPNNTPCTRSLTCKSHSMGAKRAVTGRSHPYDVLLAAYQKKAIGRPQAGAMSAASSVPNKALKGNLKKGQGQAGSPAPSSGTATDDPYVDSDEEVESIMQALRHSHPAPLAQKAFYFVKRRRQCYRLRDILLDAITPKQDTHVTAAMDARQSPYYQGQSTPSAHSMTPTRLNFPSTPNAMMNFPSASLDGNNAMFGSADAAASPSSVSTSYSVR